MRRDPGPPPAARPGGQPDVQSQAPRAHPRLGRRIAGERARLGWTQQELAERVGISRVAMSTLETGTSQPSERTVVLLAGIFKLEPHELVAGTDYPPGKVDRLPLVAARHTHVELLTALLERDLSWLDRGDGSADEDVLDRWRRDLSAVAAEVLDPRERAALTTALALVAARTADRPAVRGAAG